MERQVLNHSVAALVCLFTNAAFAQEDAKSFLSEHCTACHNSADQAGKLNVESLRFEPSDPDNSARWIKIHDRVKSGEMPPPDEVELAKVEADTFVDGLAKLLTDSETERYRNRGRATLRRLNRYEYENAVRDLLNVPWAQIK